jgi:hypothetical protein
MNGAKTLFEHRCVNNYLSLFAEDTNYIRLEKRKTTKAEAERNDQNVINDLSKQQNSEVLHPFTFLLTTLTFVSLSLIRPGTEKETLIIT